MSEDKQIKRAVIVGATSGIGREVAQLLLEQGWRIGIAGRREDALIEIQRRAPEKVVFETIDITQENASDKLNHLINQLGGMDLFLLSSGIGFQNRCLNPEIELRTVKTNTEGFTRMTTAAFQYFKTQKKGHLAVISSIAGTKGLGVAPAYSATKRFQNIYINALEQLSHLDHLNIDFTDIRPGFVATDLLGDGKKYPLLMNKTDVAKRIIKAINKKERTTIIDWRYRILVFFWQFIPQWIWKRLTIKTST